MRTRGSATRSTFPKASTGCLRAITATAGAFNLMFARTMATDVYDKAFLTQLDELGIDYDVVGEMTYATPRSGLLQALGLA